MTTRLFILCMLFSLHVGATHILGGELGYTYTGAGNVYRIELHIYTDPSSSASLNFTNVDTVNIGSSCSAFLKIPVTRFRTDSLVDYCPGLSSTALPVVMIRHAYSGTITLPPCADWTMYFERGDRSFNITNLPPATGNGVLMRLSAFLDNSNAPNSAPVIASKPLPIMPVGTIATMPYQVYDLDNDSVVSEMTAPQTANGINMSYTSGYSTARPFGTNSYTTFSGGYGTGCITAYAQYSGLFSLANRSSDYRNGHLVGYATREWVIYCTSSPVQPPLPAAGSTFATHACPGVASSIGLHFIAANPADSVFLEITPQNNFGYTISYAPGAGGATTQISWTTPASLNPVTTPYYLINVRAFTNRCPLPGSATYAIMVKTDGCSADSVWPGDVNSDYVVDRYDPLYLALAMGDTGAARNPANTSWQAQAASAWNGNFFNGTNYKHADCDGNGVVANADTAVISANYTQIHHRGDEPAQRGTGAIPLYFDDYNVLPYPGSTIEVPVMLGSTASPMGKMLGIAANLGIDNIQPEGLAVAATTSWIGNATNTLLFTKSTGTNTIDWALARTDHHNVNGSARIASVKFTIPAATPVGRMIILKLDNVRIIDSSGVDLTGYYSIYDTLVVRSTGVSGLSSTNNYAFIAPNPSAGSAALRLKTDAGQEATISIVDIAGRLIWKAGFMAHASEQEIALPGNLSSGMYLVHVVIDGLPPATLKWVKGQ